MDDARYAAHVRLLDRIFGTTNLKYPPRQADEPQVMRNYPADYPVTVRPWSDEDARRMELLIKSKALDVQVRRTMDEVRALLAEARGSRKS